MRQTEQSIKRSWRARRQSVDVSQCRSMTVIASTAGRKRLERIAIRSVEKMQSDLSGQEKERACKPKRKSRTLNFNKWMGGASSVLAGVMAISDSFGYMKMDWTCILLGVALVGICAYNYWLRLHTTVPVK